uniref:Ig-like domain-containing protein n=1 Tax=Cyanoderma ruficeps TaxID=181631 RepID=A0A8C3QRE0_9PASS
MGSVPHKHSLWTTHAVALAGWCPLSPAGPRTTQLLLEPPWTPAVLWDRVTLTCQGSGTAGVTTWYKDGQRWEQTGSDNFRVNRSGTYTCERPGSGLRPPGLADWLVLQVPARALLEGDMVTLRCRPWRNMLVTEVQFYRGDEKVSPSLTGTELPSPGIRVTNPPPLSFPELFTPPVLEGPPEPIGGSPLNLSCLSTPSPL